MAHPSQEKPPPVGPPHPEIKEGSEHHGHGGEVVMFLAFALLLGVLCRAFSRYLPVRLPYTVMLLILGVLWGVMDELTDSKLGSAADQMSRIDPHLFLLVFLPPLIFEGAFSMRWHIFKQLLPQMLVLACLGVIISTILTGLLIKAAILPSFSLSAAFLLGAILSATDPVAVVALLKSIGASTKLRTLIEGESLLNDGTAIVLFVLFFKLAEGESVTAGDVVVLVLRLVFGGIALGVAWACGTIFLIKRIFNDYISEASLTISSCYLLFYVAEDLCHVSGVLALVTLGAGFVYTGKAQITPEAVSKVQDVWHLLSYIGETIVFVSVGVIIPQRIHFDTLGARDYGGVLLLYLLLMLVRALMVLVLSPVLFRLGYGFGFRRGIVLIHGSLRGAIALALALIVGLSSSLPTAVQEQVLLHSAGIAFLTLVLNATTAESLIRFLGLSKASKAETALLVQSIGAINTNTRAAVRRTQEGSPQWAVACDWGRVERLCCFVEPATDSRMRRASSSGDAELGDEAMTQDGTCFSNCLDRIKSRYAIESTTLQQLRQRYLRGTMELYRKMTLNGTLTPDAYSSLINAAETAQDRCHVPIENWKQLLEAVCSTPTWLELLVTWTRGTLLAPLVARVLDDLLRRSVRICRAYIDANREMLSQFQGAEHLVRELQHEVHADTTLCKRRLQQLVLIAPDSVTSVISAQMTSMLLSETRGHVQKLAGQGLLLDSEISHFDKVIGQQKQMILQGHVPFKRPSREQSLAASPLLLELTPSEKQACEAAATFQSCPINGTLPSPKRGGVCILLEGELSYDVEGSPTPGAVYAGSCFNTAYAVPCMHAVTMTPRYPVVVASVPPAAIRPLLRNSLFAQRYAMQIAFEVLLQHRTQAAHVVSAAHVADVEQGCLQRQLEDMGLVGRYSPRRLEKLVSTGQVLLVDDTDVSCQVSCLAIKIGVVAKSLKRITETNELFLPPGTYTISRSSGDHTNGLNAIIFLSNT